jgi:hypothetical protein
LLRVAVVVDLAAVVLEDCKQPLLLLLLSMLVILSQSALEAQVAETLTL